MHACMLHAHLLGYLDPDSGGFQKSRKSSKIYINRVSCTKTFLLLVNSNLRAKSGLISVSEFFCRQPQAEPMSDPLLTPSPPFVDVKTRRKIHCAISVTWTCCTANLKVSEEVHVCIK